MARGQPDPVPPSSPSSSAGTSPSTRGNANHLLNFRHDDPGRARGGGGGGRSRDRRPHAAPPPSSHRAPPPAWQTALRRSAAVSRAAHLAAPGLRFLASNAARLPRAAAAAPKGGLAAAFSATTLGLPDWDDVLAAALDCPLALFPACPISLESPPPAPVLTRCGHVFSGPALAAHLASGGAKCPLCYAPVSCGDARPLALAPAPPPPSPGDVVDFVLLRRPRKWDGGDVAVVRGGGEGEEVGGGSSSSLVGALLPRVRKFVKTTPVGDAEAAATWAAEAAALAALAAAARAGGGPDAAADAAAAGAALADLEHRAAAWAGRRARLLAAPAAGVPGGESGGDDDGGAAADAAAAAATALVRSAAAGRSHAGFKLAPARAPPSPPPPTDDGGDPLFFYQAADGSPTFVAPLDARVLASGRSRGYADLPPTLTARVAAVDSVDAASPAARALPLDHLPRAGALHWCSLDNLGGLGASQEALNAHAGELASRERRWRAAAAKAARAAAAEAAADAAAAAAAAASAAAAAGPSAAELAAMPRLAAAVVGEGAGADDSDPPPPPPPPPPAAGVSFARIAREGFAATGPALSASPGAFPALGAGTPPAGAGARGPPPAAGPSPPGSWAAAARSPAPPPPPAAPRSRSRW